MIAVSSLHLELSVCIPYYQMKKPVKSALCHEMEKGLKSDDRVSAYR